MNGRHVGTNSNRLSQCADEAGAVGLCACFAPKSGVADCRIEMTKKKRRRRHTGRHRDIGAEYPHWNRVYITVIIYTTLLIIGLWAISKLYQ
jgi:hypothetical protein